MAVQNITMPQLGESVTEGTISRWLVQPGDTVNKYDPLAEVMTDKVNAEIPSSFSGTIKELIAKEDETLAVGKIICTIETEEAEEAADERETFPSEAGTDHSYSKEKKARPKLPKAAGSNNARYSPAVLRMADEHGIDLTQVEGSGKQGRITRKDLQQLIDSGTIPRAGENEKAPKEQEVPPQKSFLRPAPISVNPGDVEVPVTSIRKTIAANMVRSKHEIPHAWMMMEVDVTSMVQYRDSLKDEFKQKEGFNLTYFAFFVKAVAQALKEFPMMNSMWAGNKIVQKKDINISIAVASEDVLFVPVIKNADEQSIKGIAREIVELAHKAREGKLKAEDIQGGTFTVNNTGSFGSVQSMGIINYPQAAILQVESIIKRPVVMTNGGIAVRDMANICLSLDHRVLDGLICGNFLKRVKDILENVTKNNTSIY